MILAYDLASKTGVALGEPGAAPRCWSFVIAGSNGEKFSQLARIVTGHVNQHKPDLVVIEAPFVMNNSAVALLFGFRAITFAVCGLRSVPVAEYTPKDIRKHFLGTGGMKRVEAKKAVMARCRSLGWVVAGDDEADAAALWDYAASKASPAHANMTLEIGDARHKT